MELSTDMQVFWPRFHSLHPYFHMFIGHRPSSGPGLGTEHIAVNITDGFPHMWEGRLYARNVNHMFLTLQSNNKFVST